MGNCCTNQESSLKNRAITPKENNTMIQMVKVQSRKRRGMSAILRYLCRKHAKTQEDAKETSAKEQPKLDKTSKDTQKSHIIKEIFIREEEFLACEQEPWEEYQSYFPGGIPVKESCSKNDNQWGSCTAQVGDWEVISIKTNEEFPEVKQVEEWELQSISSADNVALSSIYTAPGIEPYSICEDFCKKRTTGQPRGSSPNRDIKKN